jgi:transglutaminase-like putative cysteine protease
MLYDVAAEISYAYGAPAVAGRTLLRLMPATVAGEQRLIAGRLAVDPDPAERVDRRDFFGNPVTELAFRTASRTARFRIEARVERLAQPPRLDLSPPLAGLAREMDAVASLQPAAPHHFLPASPRVPAAPALAAWAAAQLPEGATVMAALRAVGRALHAEMRFDAGATTVETDPRVAFAARHGVCQDFSHILIACLRGLGVPAGYVSGYLRTLPPPGAERLTGADAMHAWVRVWCGIEAGWIDYDPTNDCLVGADHLRVALGRDYDDVAPLRGVLRSAGAQESRHHVDVVPLETAG